jgi:membrane protein
MRQHDGMPDDETQIQPGDEIEVTVAKSWIHRVYIQLDIAFSRFGQHRLTDWAAAMTYYSMLSIFPALLVLVSVLGLVGHSATIPITENVQELAPSAVRDVFVSAVHGLERSGSTATVLLIVGLITALFSASSYIGAYIRAAGIVLGVKEDRPFRTIPLRLALTTLLMTLVLLVVMIIVLTGPIAKDVAKIVGWSANGLGGWGFLRIPIVVGLAVMVLSILYSLGPNFETKRYHLVTPGIVLAVFLWLVLSLGFSLYVSSFARYNKVYGSLAGVVIFLIWLWLSNVAVLLGLEFDSELRRYKRVHGHSALRFRRR